MPPKNTTRSFRTPPKSSRARVNGALRRHGGAPAFTSVVSSQGVKGGGAGGLADLETRSQAYAAEPSSIVSKAWGACICCSFIRAVVGHWGTAVHAEGGRRWGSHCHRRDPESLAHTASNRNWIGIIWSCQSLAEHLI